MGWMIWVIIVAALVIGFLGMYEIKRIMTARECKNKYWAWILPPSGEWYEKLCEPAKKTDRANILKIKEQHSEIEHEYIVGTVTRTKWGGIFGQTIPIIMYYEGIPDPILSMKTRSMPLLSAKMQAHMRTADVMAFLKKWQEEHSEEALKRSMTIWFILLGVLVLVGVVFSILAFTKANQAVHDLHVIEKALGIIKTHVTPAATPKP